MRSLIVLFFVQNVIATMDTNWWKYTTVYEVYIWSFKDSNGDGIGDIKGITHKLDHFVDLGIETLYLTPFYKSPMIDMGYDISDFTQIDEKFGTMEDFEELIREMKKRGLKLITDLVLNHSSDEHPWFLKSINNIHPYSDFFIWRDPAGFDDSNGSPIPPNNWISLFEGSAWTWNEKRKQFYLHQFLVQQPDFNLRNKFLRKEVQKILKFWLEKGVAGFRLDAPRHYFEDKLFRNEPPKNPKNKNIQKYVDLDHIYTVDLPEVYDYMYDDIRSVTDEYSRKEGDFERILIAEAYADWPHTMAYYGKKDRMLMNYPFNFEFIRFKKILNAKNFEATFTTWLNMMPKGAVANWVADNHDNVRFGSKIDKQYMDILLITVMMAPGVACLYYGQEIGMINGPVRPDQKQDNGLDDLGRTRDEERLPMQWDDSLNAGFSSNIKPWLPVNPDYWTVNVKAQKKTKNSMYNLVKTLSALRKTKTLKHGSFKSYIISTWIYAFTRTYRRHETYVIVLNLGSEIEIVDLHNVIPNLSQKLVVAASSINCGYEKGTTLNYFAKFPNMFLMRPQSAIVLKSVYDDSSIDE